MTSSRTRKGGFGDSGTLGVNGELPVALPVEVASEAALVDELSKIKASLGPKVEWSDRVHALVRLEGLVLGGAADSHGAFPHLILPLRSPLEEQLQDRRSAVSRQACHVVNVLVQACGVHFEPLAVALMPALFKAQAMAITIVTQAADECALALIRYCPCGRLLPPLCNRILQDKNGKLRLAAAAYVLQALEEWDHGVYASTRAVMERAILAAAQDATSDTRILGRAMFAAYYARHKEAAHDMLSGLPATEHALRDKLVQAVNQQLGAGKLDQQGFAALHLRSTHAMLNHHAPWFCCRHCGPGCSPSKGATSSLLWRQLHCGALSQTLAAQRLRIAYSPLWRGARAEAVAPQDQQQPIWGGPTLWFQQCQSGARGLHACSAAPCI